jgi:hypothetical protein
MNANRFFRRFVTEILRESTSVAPRGSLQLKDLYVGQMHGKLVKPWVGASISNNSDAAYHCVSTPGHGYRCVSAPGSEM